MLLIMRFYKISVLYPALVVGLVFCRAVEYPRTAVLDIRDLLGLLGDTGNAPPAPAITPTPTTTQVSTPTTSFQTGEIRTSQQFATKTESQRTTLASTTTHATASSSSGTMTSSLTSSHIVSSTSSSLSASFTATGYVADESTTPPAELQQWKVIGIAVITVTFIAIIVLAVSFFDSWWGFVCDAFCGKRRKQKYGGENLVPDWGKRSWEFKLANEDGHRYPTLASLETIVKEKDKVKETEAGRKGRFSSYEMAYGGYQ